MKRLNPQSTQVTVQRRGEQYTVDVEADVCGDIVCIQGTTCNGQVFLLDDNETSAARFLILNKIWPKQGHDRRAANLLRIAKEFPYYA